MSTAIPSERDAARSLCTSHCACARVLPSVTEMLAACYRASGLVHKWCWRMADIPPNNFLVKPQKTLGSKMKKIALTSTLLWDLRNEAGYDYKLTPALEQRVDQLVLEQSTARKRPDGTATTFSTSERVTCHLT